MCNPLDARLTLWFLHITTGYSLEAYRSRFRYISKQGWAKNALRQGTATVNLVRNEMCHHQGIERSLFALSKEE